MDNTDKYCDCHGHELDDLPNPLFRLVCHCTTCQAFYGAPYNDECTFLLKDCGSVDLSNVDLKGYQGENSPIKRGVCKGCGKTSHSTVKFGPFAEFLIIPTERLRQVTVPTPFAHLYYHSRVADVDSAVRKVGGHVLSQLSIMMMVLKSLLLRRS